jgi:hypothetical protein
MLPAGAAQNTVFHNDNGLLNVLSKLRHRCHGGSVICEICRPCAVRFVLAGKSR